MTIIRCRQYITTIAPFVTKDPPNESGIHSNKSRILYDIVCSVHNAYKQMATRNQRTNVNTMSVLNVISAVSASKIEFSQFLCSSFSIRLIVACLYELFISVIVFSAKIDYILDFLLRLSRCDTLVD